jgi:uncharacterized ferritin-like protein (DUF455 family)
MTSPGPTELRAAARAILTQRDPAAKAAATRALWDAVDQHPLDTEATLDEPPALPGRPARPALVPPKQVPLRTPFTLPGRAALLHAVAHIEFNAINLALDAVWRFAGLPAAYYLDWLRVASEEALHFSLLEAHLASLGHRYGDFDAHNGLWDMAERTRDDFTARMALVPRILEARGLDVTPGMQARFERAGAVEILSVILRDEIGHVAVGNRWYHWGCARHGHDPDTYGEQVALAHGAPAVRPPLNEAARLAAGFTPAELARWTASSGR